MAHSVQDASSEHLQVGSESTNLANSTELRAIIKRNKELNNSSEKAPSSDGTDPFTTNELGAIIKHHKQANPPVDGEKSSPGCSGITNPFTSNEFEAIQKRHEYNTRSKRKIGTRHPALQGPILEPGRWSNRGRSVRHRDPSKKGGVVENGKSTKPGRLVDHGKSSKQARVLERSKSRQQGTRVGGQVKRNPRTAHDTPISNKASSTTKAGHSTICRKSITRATLKLGTESLINIATGTVGMSQKHTLHTTREFALTQSQHDFGVKLHISGLHLDRGPYGRKGPSKPIRLDLLFDPNSDLVLLVNKTLLSARQLLVIKPLPISPEKLSPTLGYLGQTALRPSSYRFFVSDGHIFDVTFLPRRYVALDSGPRQRVMQSAKRTLDMLSQHADPSAAKRVKTKGTSDQSKGKGQGKEANGKLKGKQRETNDTSKEKGKGQAANDGLDAEETTDELNVSTVVRTRPPSNELIPASASPFPSGSDLRAGYVFAVNHPLEELQQNATIKIANAIREEDYTLVRRDNIANQENTLVFKAHHSKIPGKLIVVKIWHSTSDLNLTPGAGARFLSNVSGYFLNEVKNHLKVSEHPRIASLYSFDVRLLALYMEHINAPTLAFYRDPGDNPYCTLDDSDAERVLNDLAGALKFIHDKDVVHNDIKPANILYSKERPSPHRFWVVS